MHLLISLLIVFAVSLTVQLNPVQDTGFCDTIDQSYLNRQPNVLIFEPFGNAVECNWRLVDHDIHSDDCYPINVISFVRGPRGKLGTLRVQKQPANCSGTGSVNLVPSQQLIYYGEHIDYDNEFVAVNCCSALFPYNGTLITIETNDRLVDPDEESPTPWFLQTTFIVTLSVLTVMCSFIGFLIHSIKIIIREQNAGNLVV